VVEGVGSVVGSGDSVPSSVGVAEGVSVASSVWVAVGNPPVAAAAATAVPPPMATSERAAIATLAPTAVAMNDTGRTSRSSDVSADLDAVGSLG
jgi:hypothetical protein